MTHIAYSIVEPISTTHYPVSTIPPSTIVRRPRPENKTQLCRLPLSPHPLLFLITNKQCYSQFSSNKLHCPGGRQRKMSLSNTTRKLSVRVMSGNEKKINEETGIKKAEANRHFLNVYRAINHQHSNKLTKKVSHLCYVKTTKKLRWLFRQKITTLKFLNYLTW